MATSQPAYIPVLVEHANEESACLTVEVRPVVVDQRLTQLCR